MRIAALPCTSLIAGLNTLIVILILSVLHFEPSPVCYNWNCIYLWFCLIHDNLWSFKSHSSLSTQCKWTVASVLSIQNTFAVREVRSNQMQHHRRNLGTIHHQQKRFLWSHHDRNFLPEYTLSAVSLLLYYYNVNLYAIIENEAQHRKKWWGAITRSHNVNFNSQTTKLRYLYYGFIYPKLHFD